MAGTINLSLQQQLDEYGQPLSGGKLYFIQAGTISTPQNAFQDTGLSIAMPNPITLDAAGRVPQFFLADGQIKVRLQDKNGVVKFQADNLLVIGPSAGGGGGGGSVDPTTVMQTGDIKVRYDTAIISGFVRCNGKTIGSAGSGATELADPSAQALFSYLWLKDPNLAVTPGGRGANAAADWTANKQIALPDGRSRSFVGLDDMGNAPSGRITSIAATTLGAAGGAETATLLRSDLPNVAPGFHGTAAIITVNGSLSAAVTANTFNSGTAPNPATNAPNQTINFSASGNYTPGGTIDSLNGGVAQTNVNKLPPLMLITVYLKL